MKRKNWFIETLFSLFFQGFLCRPFWSKSDQKRSEIRSKAAQNQIGVWAGSQGCCSGVEDTWLDANIMANLPQSENHANFELTYPHLLAFTLLWKIWTILQTRSFPIWMLTLSMPHVCGCLKTSSQDNCIWSDRFCTVNSEKPPKLEYVNITPQPFYSLVFLQSGGLGDEHLDHSNHSDLVSSENGRRTQTVSPVDLRLGEPLAITSAELASKSSTKNAVKTARNILEIWLLFLKRWKFHTKFPSVFPTVFPDVSVPGKQEVPLNQGISKSIFATLRGGAWKPLSLTGHVAKKRDGGWLPLWPH